MQNVRVRKKRDKRLKPKRLGAGVWMMNGMKSRDVRKKTRVVSVAEFTQLS